MSTIGHIRQGNAENWTAIKHLKYQNKVTIFSQFNMWSSVYLFLVCVSMSVAHHFDSYSICTDEKDAVECEHMTDAVHEYDIRMRCILVRDRVECLKKIEENEVDLGVFEPEDMYLSLRDPERLLVIKELRTREEVTEEFRYSAVAIVRNDLHFESLADLKFMNSCHTGFGRTAGYKIPVTKLQAAGVLRYLNDPALTPIENEIRGLSRLFYSACIVGAWAPDDSTDLMLKEKYKNLCALCDSPATCGRSDKFAGYEGSLRCLTEGHGDVAWSKISSVRSFFQERPDAIRYYNYLCPDGTTRSLNLSNPCEWGRRPWVAFMTNEENVGVVDELRCQIAQTRVLGEATKAHWLRRILAVPEGSTTTSDHDLLPLSPLEYLNKAGYTDVIAREVGAPNRIIKFCTLSEIEMSKCRILAEVAFSRGIRPRFGCTTEVSFMECLKSIADGGADVITLDASEVYVAERQFNLKPILAEVYGNQGSKYYAVAVVRRNSRYQSFGDLRGARSCHTGYGRTAGWYVPLYTLISQGVMSNTTCPYPQALAEFFNASCIPGIMDPENNPHSENPESLCRICSSYRKGAKNPCPANSSEDYFAYTGAFRCLAEGAGDVAFMKHASIKKNTDGNNMAPWAANLKSSDFQLLCPNGGRAEIDDYQSCYLAQIPPHKVVTSSSKSETEVEEIKLALQSAADLFSKKPEVFKLFGRYENTKDLLFKDSTTSFTSLPFEGMLQTGYNKMLDRIISCGGSL